MPLYNIYAREAMHVKAAYSKNGYFQKWRHLDPIGGAYNQCVTKSYEKSVAFLRLNKETVIYTE